MKEIKPEAPPPISSEKYPRQNRVGCKKWVIAQSRKHYEMQTSGNTSTEGDYHKIIEIVKQQWLTDGEVYYDRDLKTDHTDGSMSMHSFITASFYWRLDCTLNYDFEVRYAFFNCPFEAEIRTMLRPYPLDRRTKEVDLKPDFTTFWKNVKRIQDDAHFHYFKR